MAGIGHAQRGRVPRDRARARRRSRRRASPVPKEYVGAGLQVGDDARGRPHARPAPQLQVDDRRPLRHAARTRPGSRSTASTARSWTTTRRTCRATGARRASTCRRRSGTYDDWVIRYGYTPTRRRTPTTTTSSSQAIARESSAAGPRVRHRRGHVSGRRARSALQHLRPGLDPLAFAKERTAYVSTLWTTRTSRTRLHEGRRLVRRAAPRDGRPAARSTRAACRTRASTSAASTRSRVMKGDPGGRLRSRPSRPRTQRDALDFLAAARVLGRRLRRAVGAARQDRPGSAVRLGHRTCSPTGARTIRSCRASSRSRRAC